MGIPTSIFRYSSFVRQRTNCFEANLYKVILLVINYVKWMIVTLCVSRYLDVYERIHFLGEEVDRRESEHHEEDDARNRRKALRLLHATPTNYNAAQHVVPGLTDR